AIEVAFHGRPIKRRREMIPDPRRDARTEPSVDDRGSGSVLGFEGDGRAAEPERRVVSRAESDRMLIGVRDRKRGVEGRNGGFAGVWPHERGRGVWGCESGVAT